MPPQLVPLSFPYKKSTSHHSKMIIPNEQDAPQLARRWPWDRTITPGYVTPQGGGAFTFGGWTTMQMFLMGGVLVIFAILGIAACALGGSKKKTGDDAEADGGEEGEEKKDDDVKVALPRTIRGHRIPKGVTVNF